MSDYYVKLDNGKYKKVGWDGPELHPGLWLCYASEHSRTQQNLTVRIGDLPQPVDLQKFVSFQLLSDKLREYLANITRPANGEVWNRKIKPPKVHDTPPLLARDQYGKPTHVGLYGISMADLAEHIAKFLFKEFGNESETNKHH